MAAELVDTTRLYARNVARIDADWIEQLGAHLLKKSWSEPHWEKRAGQVVAGLVDRRPSRRRSGGRAGRPRA